MIGIRENDRGLQGCRSHLESAENMIGGILLVIEAHFGVRYLHLAFRLTIH